MNTFISTIILLLMSFTLKASQNPVYIGFLEINGVRKVFEYKDHGWKSSLIEIKNELSLKTAPNNYSSPNSWTLFYDGKSYNQISTISFVAYTTYSENGLQRLTSKEPVLAFRKFDERFTNWDGKSLRPILATNLKNLKDPDSWKIYSAQKVAPFVINDLKKRLTGVITYYNDNDCATPLKRELLDSEIVTSMSYKNTSGSELLSFKFKFQSGAYTTCNTECDMCSDRGLFWYLKSPKGDFVYLTEARSLIEAADLNQDGHSELLFWIPGYNSDGYRLIDGRSKQITDSTWSYH